MSEIHPDLIEKYQLLLEKDPKSQVFAPLSEAYRKMGLLEEAFRISSRGVQFHPRFAGGHIALANVLMEKKQFENAAEALERAVDLSPENILAFYKLGECYLRLRKGKEALKAFKMVLLFFPHNERAQKAVQKLETLTADEFDDDVFQMNPLKQLNPSAQVNAGSAENIEVLRPSTDSERQAQARDLERQLSLMEAYLVRGQRDEAQTLGETLLSKFPNNESILKRLRALRESDSPVRTTEPEVSSENKSLKRVDWIRDEKIKLLEGLLARVRQNHGPNFKNEVERNF